jgi:EAL and modified HD-GYP domain-containing signal transduction protein
MSNVFLARQPILDRDQSVEGYELLYSQRENGQTATNGHDPALATARLALGALSEIGLEHLVGESRAWINVGPEFLTPELVRNLPPERVVLELHAPSFADPGAHAALGELRGTGYPIALADFRYDPEFEPLLSNVDFVKLNMAALGPRVLARHSFKLRAHQLTLVAEKIESHDDFRLAKAAGADLFQGYFFCRPHLVGARAILPSRLALMQLAAALQDPAVQLEDLERLISGDVGLSYRLLKYINSAYFNLRGRISSIKQAVALLGIEPLRRWATLSIFAELSDKPRELFVTALIRAHFCQEAGEPTDGAPADLFTLGLFSVLDALNDTSMYAALQNLPLTPSIRDALIDHAGAGRLLECVTAIENGDFEHANEIVEGSAEYYLDSVAWSTAASKQLIG